MTRHLYYLQSDHPGKSSTHLIPYTVITIVFTIFFILFIHVTTFITGNLYLLLSFPFFTYLPKPLSSGKYQFVPYEFVSVSFVCLLFVL